MSKEWDAQGYTLDFNFASDYGADVLELLGDIEGSDVLDFGCGNGTLTQALASRGARVLGLDSSPRMLTLARQAYPDLDFVQGDICSFNATEPFDAVFSNAVFHWINEDQQDALLRKARDVLRPGGQLVFEMGARGNCETIHAALEQEFSKRGLAYRRTFYFPSLAEYATRLEAAGFTVTHAFTIASLTQLGGDDGVGEWIRMFNTTPFEGIDASTSELIVSQAVAKLDPLLHHDHAWWADYVRLRMRAIKR